MKLLFISLFGILVSNAQNSKINEITVIVTNFSSNEGRVFVALYDSESNFLNKALKGTISNIENNSCTVIFKDIPDGIYAISLFHDLNSNGKMDTNFIGIPKEDYACSNNAKGFMGPPKWNDAKFQINNKSIVQNIKI